jgi:hypothetical protein
MKYEVNDFKYKVNDLAQRSRVHTFIPKIPQLIFVHKLKH